jgi:hypothetical protein
MPLASQQLRELFLRVASGYIEEEHYIIMFVRGCEGAGIDCPHINQGSKLHRYP